MKKSSKIAIIAACLAVAALILALVLFTGNDQAATPDEYFIFTELENGTYSVKAKDVNNMPAAIVIPSEHKGKAVTIIGEKAFESCKILESVTLPESITSIRSYAFWDCSSLASLTIPENITNICNGAFSDCASFTEIYYNATECADLERDNFVFFGAGQSGDGIRVVIGANVKNIPANLFFSSSVSYCPKIVSVEFVDGSLCKTIGENAFRNCVSLRSVTIPDSIESIGAYAFRKTDYLSEIYFNAVACADFEGRDRVFCQAGRYGDGIKVFIGANVKKIPAKLFYPHDKSFYTGDVPMIVSVEFAEGSVCESIGNYAFAGCNRLKGLTIPDSVTIIGDNAFWGTK